MRLRRVVRAVQTVAIFSLSVQHSLLGHAAMAAAFAFAGLVFLCMALEGS